MICHTPADFEPFVPGLDRESVWELFWTQKGLLKFKEPPARFVWCHVESSLPTFLNQILHSAEKNEFLLLQLLE